MKKVRLPEAREIETRLCNVNRARVFRKELYPAIAQRLDGQNAMAHMIVNTIARFNPADYGVWKNADLKRFWDDMPNYIKALITDSAAQEEALRHFERMY